MVFSFYKGKYFANILPVFHFCTLCEYICDDAVSSPVLAA